MRGLKEMLMKEQQRLYMIEEKLKKDMQDVPEGALRISQSNNCIQYYQYMKGDKSKRGKYLRKSEEKLIRQLAQKNYNEKVFKLVKKRLHQISRMAEEYQEDEIERIFLDEHEVRQRLIHPVEKTWNEQLEQWIKEEYEGKKFNEETPAIYTDKGERVRSKSEKILADYFYHHNIPYKYEKPLHLAGYGTVYPDFTFLSKQTRREIYWEHEGRMDDPTYVKSALKKIEGYENNGIYIGERLILTFETESSGLSKRSIERNVKRFLNQL